MTASLPFNPLTTTVAQGAFGLDSVGLVQGDVFPDPAKVYSLASGVLAAAETLVMYGGVGIYTNVPGAANTPRTNLGSVVGRATTEANLLGFSTWSYSNINWPQNPVPVAGSGQQVRYFRMGSGVRMVLAADPVIASLRGGLTNAQVSWDFTTQQLVPFLGNLTISSGTYNTTTGVIVLTMAVPAAFSAGASLVLSALTGTGAFASLNGTWVSTAVVGSTVTLQGPVGAGAATITGGNATVGGAASSALPVQVLDIQTSNCMTVTPGANVTWNYNGSAAVVLL